MADLSDITAYLASAVTSVVYPNGTASASIAPPAPGFTNPADVKIYEGWPIAEQLDLDMQGQKISGSKQTPTSNGPIVNVSIFPMAGLTVMPYQILDNTYTIVDPAYGLTVSVSGNQITITGTPNSGEYVTIVADRQYVYSETGATAATILSALLTDAQANYPSASLVGSTLTVPYGYELDVRQGSIGTLGKVTHRQRQSIMISVWAADPSSRTKVAAAIDNSLKQTIVATMPDTTQAKITYNRTNVLDTAENVTVYRRDLIFDVEYATLEEFPGYVITSVTYQTDGGQPPYNTTTAIK